MAAAAGWDWLLAETTIDDPGTGLARQAVGAGARLVIAVGGDGTVRACAQALAGTAVALAIVPRGTANLAARALGIPARLDAALACGFGGHERRIDLATADGITFVAMAGLGTDAAVVGATPALLKTGAGWLGYAAVGARHTRRRHAAFDISLDGTPLAVAAVSVVVGNAGLLPGGFRLLPDARLDDGQLDVGVLAPSSLLDWGVVARRVMAGAGADRGGAAPGPAGPGARPGAGPGWWARAGRNAWPGLSSGPGPATKSPEPGHRGAEGVAPPGQHARWGLPACRPGAIGAP